MKIKSSTSSKKSKKSLNQKLKMKIKNSTLDLVALSSSLICAIHCASIPIMLSSTTFGSIHFLANPFIERTFIGLGFVFVLASLWPSYQKIHRKLKPLKIAVMGFIFIGLGRLHLTESWEIGNTIMGTLLVSLAHYYNWKLLGCRVHHKH